jgi:CDP-diacylglycerol--glycerol-3-phosphate 3-phosphatidyltransferase
MSASTPNEKASGANNTLTDILRARTAGIIDPIVTLLARWGVHPNMLTATGAVAHLLPAWLVSQGDMRWAAFSLFFIAPLDALDGSLSRKLGIRQGGFGAFLDSTLDRLAEIILYIGFLYYFSQRGDQWLVLATYLGITGSLMVSYARARAEALQVSCKVGILSRVERYAILTFFLLLNLPQVALILIAALTYVTVAERIVHVWRQFAAREEQE